MLSTLVTAVLPAILVLTTIHPISTLSQTLIPTTGLPTCAATCAQLQNAQTGCTPAGGAPVSNDAIYQSCFCQSALLTVLYQQPGAALCTQCSPQDMQTIQTWYQGFCKAGASALQSGGASSARVPPASTSVAVQATPSATQIQNHPTQTVGATGEGNSQGVTNADATNNGPWFSTHYKWVIMLIVLIIGLSAFGILFSLFHRRYHRRREQQWSQSTVPHPDINTWGPGQSVHDLGGWGNLKRSLSRSLSRSNRAGAAGKGAGVGSSSAAEKGKASMAGGRGREKGYAAPMPPPPMPPMKTESGGTGFGARGPPMQMQMPPPSSRGGRLG